MEQQLAGITTLTIPAGAGPADPASVIGPPPADLVAYYAGFGQTVISAWIFRKNATQYNFLAQVDGVFPFIAAGSQSGGVFNQAWSVSSGGGTQGVFNMGGVAGANVNYFPAGVGKFNIDQGVGRGLIGQGWGQVAYASSNASTAAIAGETVTLTTNGFTARAGHAYAVDINFEITASVINRCDNQIRLNNLAGTVLGGIGKVNPLAGSRDHVSGRVYFICGGADVAVTAIVQTMVVSAGNCTQLNTWLRTCVVWDIGNATDYAGNVSI